MSPVKLALVVTVDALPANVAVIVPAAKFPLLSRATMVETVPELVAVVALLLTFPAVAMVASFVSTMAAEALMSALTMVPSRIIVLVTLPVSPVVTTVPVMSGSVIILSDATEAVACKAI